jgi:hypothetical protein|tara:strand:+ start:452 stop:931 length:480 start_codon:yes stop_codon:yes gene_type:complete
MSDKKEPIVHKYGVDAEGIPLTKSGRRNKNYMPATTTKRKGRPPAASLKKPKGIIGRPKGDATIINEYKSRMLASPKSAKVLEAIFNAALDDDHKHQASAWKLVMDRVAPTAAFEQEVVKGGGKSAIQINITGIGGASVSGTKETPEDDDITDATYEVV